MTDFPPPCNACSCSLSSSERNVLLLLDPKFQWTLAFFKPCDIAVSYAELEINRNSWADTPTFVIIAVREGRGRQRLPDCLMERLPAARRHGQAEQTRDAGVGVELQAVVRVGVSGRVNEGSDLPRNTVEVKLKRFFLFCGCRVLLFWFQLVCQTWKNNIKLGTER